MVSSLSVRILCSKESVLVVWLSVLSIANKINKKGRRYGIMSLMLAVKLIKRLANASNYFFNEAAIKCYEQQKYVYKQHIMQLVI